ncbi:hypothetical protein [Terrarubrum flagellatum]|uniref:hypothetical protein n=1 Tax=Terrirubrum flagellatum TaxID=2895980 RepID=UPI003144E108
MISSAAPRPRFGARPFAGGICLAIIAGALASPAWALDTALENVVISDKDGGTLTLGRVEFTGANLAQDELAKLFAEATPADEKKALLTKLKADKIAIPQAVFAKKETKITISGLAADTIADGKVGHAGFAGVDGAGKSDDGAPVTVKSGPLSLDGADLSSLLAANPGGMRFSRFSWANVAITAPDKDTPATAAGGNLYTIGLGSLTADATFDGATPLKGAVSVKGLTVQPPAASMAGQQLKAAGYDKLDFAIDYASAYDPATKALTLDNFTINGVGAGSLQLKSTLGGIDKSAFTGQGPEKIMALLQGTISGVELNYVDAGLATKLIGLFAQQQGKQPAAFQAESAAMARQIAPMLLAGAPNAPAIGDAVARFIAQPTSISVALKPKTGSIGFAELTQIKDPAAFLAKVDVDVKSASPAAPGAAPAAPAPASPPVASAAPPAAAAPAAPRRLSGIDAWNVIVGNTISGKNDDGDPLFEYYLKNGVVKQLSDDETSTGKWSIKGGKVCFEYPDDDEESCYGVVVDGNIATFTDSDGTGKRYEILQGNPKRL